ETIQRLSLNGSRQFATRLNTLGLNQWEIMLFAVLADGAKLPLVAIRVAHESFFPDAEPHMRPVLISTLGRSGANWLIRLLAQHPEIVSSRPFQYEARALSHWMKVMRMLSQPPDYLHSIFWNYDNAPAAGWARKVPHQHTQIADRSLETAIHHDHLV